MRHARQARAAAGPAQFASRPEFEFKFGFIYFLLFLLTDALLEIQYLQIYSAKFDEIYIFRKLVKISN
jgi:hypothetical protein